MNVAMQFTVFILKSTNTYKRTASINAPTIVYFGCAIAGLILEHMNHIKTQGYKHSILARVKEFSHTYRAS
jgi:hypothetical protein